MDGLAQNPAVEHPRGLLRAKVDEKGRLKLPVEVQRYLNQVGDDRVFCTSFDERIARIYPISVWKQVEEQLRNAGDDAEAAEDLWFTANDLGGDSKMDDQGRLLMPSELRRSLKIEDAQVYLEHYRGHIKVFGEMVYQERKHRSRGNGEALKVFEKKGLL